MSDHRLSPPDSGRLRRGSTAFAALLTALAAACTHQPPDPTTTPTQVSRSEAPALDPDDRWAPPPTDRPGWKVGLTDLAPPRFRRVQPWGEKQFGLPMPRTTWRAADQPTTPLRWDQVDLLDDGRAVPGRHRYAVWHALGSCCGGCQTAALLGAVLTQYRIDRNRPVQASPTVPHDEPGSWRDHELDVRPILAVSRQTFIRGGRDIPHVSSALAMVGALFRSAMRPYEGRHPWMPRSLCRTLSGHHVPVLRARVRLFDVRYMTVALREGPVVISGSFKDLERSDGDVFRCSAHPEDPRRHHFMLVIGWDTIDTDDDGVPDEVVWLTRDDWNHQGRDHRNLDRDTWQDSWLYDEWMRIVPRGCFLDHGRAYSIIPGTVSEGTFDDPIVPGPEGDFVPFCDADPDGDGVPTRDDTCPYTPDPLQADADNDSMGDLCDPCPNTPPRRQDRGMGHEDGDHDWIPDACDPTP